MIRTKRRARSIQKPFRFTKYHKELSERMEKLIELYNMKQSEQGSELFVAKVQSCFEGWDFKYKNDSVQLSAFRDIMSMLKQNIMAGCLCHLYECTRIDVIETDVGGPKEVKDVPEHLLVKNASLALRHQTLYVHYSFKDEASKEAKKRQRFFNVIHLERHFRPPSVDLLDYAHFALVSVPQREYETSPRTPFGERLLERKKFHYLMIPALAHHRPEEFRSFSDMVRLLLIYYHLAFGSFERIKICGYKHCSKLFVEKKLGEKQFCSDSCRVKHNQASKPTGMFKCKARQNQWIDNRNAYDERLGDIPRVFHVYLFDCEKKECKNYPEGGQCPILKDKNKIAFEQIGMA